MSQLSDIKPKNSTFHWYMSGQLLWFIGMGIQFVALQAVGTLILNLPPTQLGIVQACILLPSLVFILPAGVAAERNDVRLLLIKLQLAAAIPPLALAMLVLGGKIDFVGLILYALMAGTLNAMTMPARDTLISHIVVPSRVQYAVNLATGLQFAGNMLGMVAIGLVKVLDIGYVIILGTSSLLLTAFTTYRLSADVAPAPVFLDDNLIAKRRTQMLDGLRYALKDKKIAPILALTLAMSVFYMGTFFVFFPLLVRDYYNGDATNIALINGCFWAGMMLSSLTLAKIGHVRSLGKLLVGALLSGMLVLFLLSIPMPYIGLFSLCVIWGCGGGVFMTSSRTIIQTRTPDSHRGRALSIYHLAFLGGAPFGTLLFGVLADKAPNLHHTPFAPLVGMTIVLTFVCFFSQILSIKLNEKGTINE